MPGHSPDRLSLRKKKTMSDPFEEVFDGNGASGSGLDLHMGDPVIVIPTEYIPRDLKGDKDEWVAAISADLINFSDPEKPWTDDGVRIWAKLIVNNLKNRAQWNSRNPDGNPDTNLPKMIVGIVSKGPKVGKNSPPWELKTIEDQALLSKMKSWARANLKIQSSDPFAPQ